MLINEILDLTYQGEIDIVTDYCDSNNQLCLYYIYWSGTRYGGYTGFSMSGLNFRSYWRSDLPWPTTDIILGFSVTGDGPNPCSRSSMTKDYNTAYCKHASSGSSSHWYSGHTYRIILT